MLRAVSVGSCGMIESASLRFVREGTRASEDCPAPASLAPDASVTSVVTLSASLNNAVALSVLWRARFATVCATAAAATQPTSMAFRGPCRDP